MHRIGVLSESEKKLDYVLGLTLKQFLDRRLQTIVFNTKGAKSIHEARSIIVQKKIGIGRGRKKQIVNIPSYIVLIISNFIISFYQVRKENESHIIKDLEEAETSRTRRRTIARNLEKKKNAEVAED